MTMNTSASGFVVGRMMDLSFALIILVSRVFVYTYTLALPSATTNCDMRDFTKKYATLLTQPAAPICTKSVTRRGS